MSPNKDLIFRLLNLNRVLLCGSVFPGEGSGKEDNFLNSGCCAGPRFQAGKVPPLSPALSFSMRSAAHCFSGHPVLMTQHDRLQRSSTSLWVCGQCFSWCLVGEQCCSWNSAAGTPVVFVKILLITGLLNRMHCSVTVLLERCPPAVSPSADSGRGTTATPLLHLVFLVFIRLPPLLEEKEVQQLVLIVLLLEPCRCVLTMVCRLLLQEFLVWCENTLLYRLPLLLEELGGAGASRLRRQARSRCFDFGCLSDFVSSSRLGHLFHSPSLVDAHMNSSFDTHHARVNSWGTLHAARINSGVMLIRTCVRIIHAVEFGEEQSQGV